MAVMEKDNASIVGLIIKIKLEIAKIKDLKKTNDVEQKAHFDNVRLQADGFICDLVTNIAKDLTELFMFSFELRKQDVNDEYSYDLLNGAVKPCILVDVICNNFWSKNKRMALKKELKFNLTITYKE